ncbi:hypothetical protein OJ998_23425 [Solirubrobacter taibaiensis]|nr:hypothetical protein [Solirubrobacter taibaiensis]
MEYANPIARRDFLRIVATGAAGATLAACGAEAPSEARERRRILLAYFSRPGENYHYGGRRNLRVGNTEVLARTLRQRIACDVHRIQAEDPYPAEYEATVQRNVREQEADARPALVRPPTSLERYDVVILASPIWNVRPPMIMSTFAERYDFSGKTVYPVTTHAMSGLGDAREVYAEACEGARLGRGLSVRGERVREADDEVDAWIRRTRIDR